MSLLLTSLSPSRHALATRPRGTPSRHACPCAAHHHLTHTASFADPPRISLSLCIGADCAQVNPPDQSYPRHPQHPRLAACRDLMRGDRRGSSAPYDARTRGHAALLVSAVVQAPESSLALHLMVKRSATPCALRLHGGGCVAGKEPAVELPPTTLSQRSHGSAQSRAGVPLAKQEQVSAALPSVATNMAAAATTVHATTVPTSHASSRAVPAPPCDVRQRLHTAGRRRQAAYDAALCTSAHRAGTSV